MGKTGTDRFFAGGMSVIATSSLLGFAVALVAAISVASADLPAAPTYNPIPTPYYNGNGFYAGLNLGGA
jgi:hypothetical protein